MGNGLNFRNAKSQMLRRQLHALKGHNLEMAFSDMLANGKSVMDAAAALGKSPSYGRVLLQRIIAQVGWQAA